MLLENNKWFIPRTKVKHCGATDDAVWPQSRWLCSKREKAGESKKKNWKKERRRRDSDRSLGKPEVPILFIF